VSGWAAFWLCLAVFVICDCVVALHGIDSTFWQYRTPAELKIQQGTK